MINAATSARLERVAAALLLLWLLLTQMVNTGLIWPHYLALPAGGLMLGVFNRNIKNHIWLHTVQLVTLFVVILLVVQFKELGGTGGMIYALLALSVSFYWGLMQGNDPAVEEEE